MKLLENVPFSSGPRFSKHDRARNYEEDDKNDTFHFCCFKQKYS